MVQNLVSNTLKYASGQPVLIGVRPKGSGLAIVIYDKGRGIAAEHLPEVFKEFYRVRHVRDKDVEGLGLGLSIVKRISLLINLDIQLDSRLGKGTRAMIQGLETVAPRAMVDRPVSTHSRLQGLRVCLVEDDANVLMATSALLEKWGVRSGNPHRRGGRDQRLRHHHCRLRPGHEGLRFRMHRRDSRATGLGSPRHDHDRP